MFTRGAGSAAREARAEAIHASTCRLQFPSRPCNGPTLRKLSPRTSTRAVPRGARKLGSPLRSQGVACARRSQMDCRTNLLRARLDANRCGPRQHPGMTLEGSSLLSDRQRPGREDQLGFDGYTGQRRDDSPRSVSNPGTGSTDPWSGDARQSSRWLPPLSSHRSFTWTDWTSRAMTASKALESIWSRTTSTKERGMTATVWCCKPLPQKAERRCASWWWYPMSLLLSRIRSLTPCGNT